MPPGLDRSPETPLSCGSCRLTILRLWQWLVLGANVNDLAKAVGAAPLSHAAFFGSIVAMEAVFYMYYLSWNLFQTLPVVGLVGAVTLLSGTKALGEVQSRRLAGER